MENLWSRAMQKIPIFLFSFFFVLVCGEANAAGWSVADPLITARANHSSTLLPDGRILVAGGDDGANPFQSAEVYDPVSNAWAAATALSAPRTLHTATLIPDGRILVVGGDDGTAPLAGAEVYDPVTGSWSSTVNSLTDARFGHTATLLLDGRVLVAGGEDGAGPVASAELYDPATDSWSTTDSMTLARHGHTSSLLPDGRVLVAGGNNLGSLASCELYDPATGAWSPATGMSAARTNHTANLLPNGRILVAGGDDGGALTSAELYNPATNSWAVAGPLAAARYSHSATLMPDGRILVTGGLAGPLDSAELYDSVLNSWSPAGTLAEARVGHAATLMSDGRVLLAGGGNGGPLSTAQLYDPTGSSSWSAAGSLNTARELHTATLLPDGRVLIAGGKGLLSHDSSEIYDPSTNTWSTAGNLISARIQHTATLLADGRVLVTGGNNGTQLNSCELFDPVTSSWSAAADMLNPRRQHSATLLPDGRVLVMGGYGGTPLYSAELYDPVTDTWSPAERLAVTRIDHSATLLTDGRVLVAGGNNGNYLRSAEVYDPATDTWTSTPDFSDARYRHSATLLANGHVLVAGGDGENGVPLSSAELYDPVLNSWSSAGSPIGGEDLTATLLPDGRVLVVGGWDDINALSSAELYEPFTNTWLPAGSLADGRYRHSATLLPDGRVLVAGGVGASSVFLNDVELFNVRLGFSDSWRPTITSMPSSINPNASFPIAGFGFRGVGNTGGSSGTTNSSDSGYPLVQISSDLNGEARWLSPQNFTSNSYAAAPITGFPYGPAWITLIVNGIPSVARHVVVEKTMATVTLDNLSHTYDGDPKKGTVTTDPAGLTVECTYDGEADQTDAGIYTALCVVNETTYQGSATGSLTIDKAVAAVTLDNLSHTYDGNPKSATAITSADYLVGVDFTYDGSPAAPTDAGTYFVVGTINDANYQGEASAIMTIDKAPATVTLGIDSLNQNYDGFPKHAVAETVPPGLNVVLTYNGSAGVPVDVGSYIVVAAIQESNYQPGMDTAILTISPVAPIVATAPVSNVTYSSALSGGNVTFDGGLPVSGRGVCWNEIGSPTTGDTCTDEGPDDSEPFTSILTNLSSGTTYYVRAYATNSENTTAYGDQESFTTVSTWTLSIAKEGPGNGTVTSTSTPAGIEGNIDCGSECEKNYVDAAEVTLTATPEPGSRFTGWSGDADCIDDGEEAVVIMTRDISCTANFYRFPWSMFLPAIHGGSQPAR